MANSDKDKYLLEKKFLKLFLNYKLHIGLVLLFSVVFIAINILKPYILSLLFDSGIEQQDLEMVISCTFYFFLIILFTVAFSISYEYLVSTFANKYIYDLRMMLIRHIVDLPISFFNLNSTGDIITRINNDVEDIRNFMLFDITIFYQAILSFIGASIFIGVMQWKILIANLIILPILYYVLKYFRKLLYEVSIKVKNSYSDSNKELVEGIKYINELKATNFELFFLKKQSDKFKDLLKKSIKSSVVNQSSSSFIQLVINLTYIITIGYGGYLILKGDMTTGMLLAFLTMRTNLVAPVKAWSDLYNKYFAVKASLDRLKVYYYVEPEPGLELNITNKNFPGDSSLMVSNLTFGYSEKKNIFENFTAVIKTGEWIGIKGNSGAGKTTFFKLLLKLIKLENGSIKYGDININSVNNRDWRDLVGYVSQNSFTINDSIKNNILMGRENISDERISDVLKLCCLYDEVQSLHEKLNTNINENGALFSGGMVKRLMLARIVIEPPKILLLDEFFSSLDNETSQKIMNNLYNSLPKDTIVFIISHRNEDFVMCDNMMPSFAKNNYKENSTNVAVLI